MIKKTSIPFYYLLNDNDDGYCDHDFHFRIHRPKNILVSTYQHHYTTFLRYDIFSFCTMCVRKEVQGRKQIKAQITHDYNVFSSNYNNSVFNYHNVEDGLSHEFSIQCYIEFQCSFIILKEAVFNFTYGNIALFLLFILHKVFVKFLSDYYA